MTNFLSTDCSITQVYSEYHGLGEFEGVPVDGGWNEIEKQFKASWRSTTKKLYTTAESKHFTRVKRLVQWIDKCAENSNVDVNTILNDLDVYYRENPSFSGLVENIDTIYKKEAAPCS